MALNDDATLVVGAGNYYTATTGSAIPANLLAPAVPWSNIGHTSLEDILALASEGGEATVIGTLQKKALRTSYSARTETFTFTLQQFDEESLKLYFGSNMVPDAGGVDSGLLGVPQDPTPTVRAFLVVFVDGANHFAFYAPKAEIFRGDDMSVGSTDALAGLPISVKPMIDGVNTWAYAVTPLAAA